MLHFRLLYVNIFCQTTHKVICFASHYLLSGTAPAMGMGCSKEGRRHRTHVDGALRLQLLNFPTADASHALKSDKHTASVASSLATRTPLPSHAIHDFWLRSHVL